MSSSLRRRSTGLFGALVVLVVAFTAVTTMNAVAQTDDDVAQRAAEEISAARDRANQAAEDYFAAESELDVLDLDRERLRGEIVDLQALVDQLQSDAEQIAVNRFIASGTTGIPVLTDLREPMAQLHSEVLTNIVADTGATVLDNYEAAREQLDDAQDELDMTEVALEEKQEGLLELQAAAEAEVERLRSVEAGRLENEAIAQALVAMAAEEARQYGEFERRAAEASRRAEESPVVAVGADLGADAVTVDGNTAGNAGASGGEVGGRTGGGGSGSDPRAAGIGFQDTILCPVLGASAYGDTWGAPRSGGRRHQGVDMIAGAGTPLQAVISGEASQRSNVLGGITVSLLGDNGNRYYYAHLSGYEGVSGRVEQGQVIGYVGSTGNAGIPHLHFEIRPGGGVQVNPYPSVLAAGC